MAGQRPVLGDARVVEETIAAFVTAQSPQAAETGWPGAADI
jgi:hypothetical protein